MSRRSGYRFSDQDMRHSITLERVAVCGDPHLLDHDETIDLARLERVEEGLIGLE
jgi:hypothetical protein